MAPFELVLAGDDSPLGANSFVVWIIYARFLLIEAKWNGKILTDIIKFSVADNKIHQSDGYYKPISDGRLEPLIFSHDAAGVRRDEA